MKAALEWIGLSWERYWGDGYFQYLLLAAVVYLLIFHRKKQSVRHALSFSGCLLFFFLFPPTAKCLFFCIGEDVYWRVLWLLPAIPVIALAATEFLRGRHSRLAQAALLLVCCGVIALSGKDMLSAGNYSRTSNRMKVPDEIAHVGNMIREEAEANGITEIRVLGDEYLLSYLRVYDPSFIQAYGRGDKDPLSWNCVRLYHLIKAPEPRKYRRIANLARKAGFNFLVISVPENEVWKIRWRGYEKVGDVGSYVVFRRKSS